MSKTAFEKMWDGEIPTHTLYRNDGLGLMVTLDSFPATPGHSMVIPREPIGEWFDTPTPRLLQTALLGKFVARHLMATLEPIRVVRVTSGYGVQHYHDHYLPSYTRGDAAEVFDPARTRLPMDSLALKTAEQQLRFSADYVQEVDEALLSLSTLLNQFS